MESPLDRGSATRNSECEETDSNSFSQATGEGAVERTSSTPDIYHNEDSAEALAIPTSLPDDEGAPPHGSADTYSLPSASATTSSHRQDPPLCATSLPPGAEDEHEVFPDECRAPPSPFTVPPFPFTVPRSDSGVETMNGNADDAGSTPLPSPRCVAMSSAADESGGDITRLPSPRDPTSTTDPLPPIAATGKPEEAEELAHPTNSDAVVQENQKEKENAVEALRDVKMETVKNDRVSPIAEDSCADVSSRSTGTSDSILQQKRDQETPPQGTTAVLIALPPSVAPESVPTSTTPTPKRSTSPPQPPPSSTAEAVPPVPHVKTESDEWNDVAEEHSKPTPTPCEDEEEEEEEEEEECSARYPASSRWGLRPTRVITRRAAAALASKGEVDLSSSFPLDCDVEELGSESMDGPPSSRSSRRTATQRSGGAKTPVPLEKLPALPPVPVWTETALERDVQCLRRLLLSPFPAALQPDGVAPQAAGRISARSTARKTRHRAALEETPLLQLVEERRLGLRAGPDTLPESESESDEDGNENLLTLLDRVCQDKMYVLGAWRRFYDARERWRGQHSAAAGANARGSTSSARRSRTFTTLPRRSHCSRSQPGNPVKVGPPPSTHFEFPSWMCTAHRPLRVGSLFPAGSTPVYYHTSWSSAGQEAESSVGKKPSAHHPLPPLAPMPSDSKKRRREPSAESDPSAARDMMGHEEVPLPLTQQEMALYGEFVMSNGKLRHECPDPYLFLTTRGQLFRARLEGQDVDSLS